MGQQRAAYYSLMVLPYLLPSPFLDTIPTRRFPDFATAALFFCLLRAAKCYCAHIPYALGLAARRCLLHRSSPHRALCTWMISCVSRVCCCCSVYLSCCRIVPPNAPPSSCAPGAFNVYRGLPVASAAASGSLICNAAANLLPPRLRRHWSVCLYAYNACRTPFCASFCCPSHCVPPRSPLLTCGHFACRILTRT